MKRALYILTGIRDAECHHWSYSGVQDTRWIIRLRIDTESDSWKWLKKWYITHTNARFEDGMYSHTWASG